MSQLSRRPVKLRTKKRFSSVEWCRLRIGRSEKVVENRRSGRGSESERAIEGEAVAGRPLPSHCQWRLLSSPQALCPNNQQTTVGTWLIRCAMLNSQ